MNYECQICYETIQQKEDIKWLPCSHSLCVDCFHRLNDDRCPYCRKEFMEIIHVKEKENIEPEDWLYLDYKEWVVYSKYSRNGTEIIYTCRQSEEPAEWRNDVMMTKIKRRRQRKNKNRNYVRG